MLVFLAALSLVFAGMCFGNIKNDSMSDLALENPGKVGVSRVDRAIKKTVADTPMEKMAPYLEKQNDKVAAYLVAIAKKESNWGKYSPKKRGKECYNFWGYRGRYNRNAAGYSCFDSPEQAVDVVGRRVGRLIAQKIDTPREMVVWKCGNACSAASSPEAAKWVSDVSMYYKKVYN